MSEPLNPQGRGAKTDFQRSRTQIDSDSRLPFGSPSLRRIISLWPILAVLVFAWLALGGIEKVAANETCLLIQGGKIEKEWTSGYHWRFWPITDVTCYRTSRLTYEAGTGLGPQVDFPDEPISARSKDGDLIESVGFRISFFIPAAMTGPSGEVVDANNLQTIYVEGGIESEQAMSDQVIGFYARPEVRTVMQLHTTEELLQGDLAAISKEIADRLRPEYAEHGVILEDFLIGKPSFGAEYDAKLQQLAQAEIDTQIEAENALKEAEKGKTRATTASADATVAAVNAEAAASRSIAQANVDATVVSMQAEAAADQSIEQANVNATVVALNAEAAASQAVDQANVDATVVAVQVDAAASQAITQANADATVAAIAADVAANEIVTQAEAEAAAIAMQVAAYGGPEAYLAALQVEAMRGWPVQIIGDNSMVPFYEVDLADASPTPDPTPTPSS